MEVRCLQKDTCVGEFHQLMRRQAAQCVVLAEKEGSVSTADVKYNRSIDLACLPNSSFPNVRCTSNSAPGDHQQGYVKRKRPRGRAPKGKEWDAQKGDWVIAGGSDSNSPSNVSSRCYTNLASSDSAVGRLMRRDAHRHKFHADLVRCALPGDPARAHSGGSWGGRDNDGDAARRSARAAAFDSAETGVYASDVIGDDNRSGRKRQRVVRYTCGVPTGKRKCNNAVSAEGDRCWRHQESSQAEPRKSARNISITEISEDVSAEAVELRSEIKARFPRKTVTGIFKGVLGHAGFAYYACFHMGQPHRRTTNGRGNGKWYQVCPKDRPAAVHERASVVIASVATREAQAREWSDRNCDLRDAATKYDGWKADEAVACDERKHAVRRAHDAGENGDAELPLAVPTEVDGEADNGNSCRKHNGSTERGTSEVRILAWNVQGLKAKEATVISLAEQHDADAVILSETFEDAATTRVRDAFHDSGWIVRGSRRRGIGGGGVTVLMRKSRGNWTVGIESSDNEAIDVHLHPKKGGSQHSRGITVVGAYLTPNNAFKKLRAATVQRITKHVVSAVDKGHRTCVVGDLNMRPSETQLAQLDGNLAQQRVEYHFGSGVSRAEFVEIEKWGLTLLNGLWTTEGVGTFKRSTTTPDQVWINGCSEQDSVSVLKDHPGRQSDHWPILVTLRAPRGLVSRDGDDHTTSRSTKIQWRQWGDREVQRYNFLYGENLTEDNNDGRLINRCENAMLRAARMTEDERKLKVEQTRVKNWRREQRKLVWTAELKKARRTYRQIRNRARGMCKDKQHELREQVRQAEREFRELYEANLKRASARKVCFWSNALRTDGRAAWREIKRGVLLGHNDLEKRSAQVCKGGLTCVQNDDSRRPVVEEQAAATEIAAYMRRLNAQDWAMAGFEWDTDFAVVYTAFQEWRGLILDTKLEDATWCAEEHDRGNPLPQLMQANFSEAEWNAAINKSKNDKATAYDEITNEHCKKLDAVMRCSLCDGFAEVYDNDEPSNWRERAVVLLDKGSTSDKRKPEQKRTVSLLSCPSKQYRQALAGRARVVMKTALKDTQGCKYDEGCAYNTLILTQKVGERLDAGKKTFVVFIDLVKAFDTVNRRLLWARLRSAGFGGRLLRGLRNGYKDRMLRGKISGDGGTWYSDPERDDGLGVTQGGVDSSELFCFFIDTLDDELRKSTEASWVGIPLDGVDGGQDVERLSVLKHADDTILIAEDAAGLRVLLSAFERWCQKWQIAPQPTKCKIMVFEKHGATKPSLCLGGKGLETVVRYVYLGMLLDKRGRWSRHVDRRISKAANWDNVARRVIGVSGGCTVDVAAHVRAATAEVGITYGAEFWAGSTASAAQKYNTRVDKHQAKIGRQLLGMRDSAEATGVLVELGWTSVSTQARRARLQLWRRLGHTKSRLLRRIEQQATQRTEVCDASEYNWWLWTNIEVQWLTRASGLRETELRAMTKVTFKRTLTQALWQEEWRARVAVMVSSSRLSRLGATLVAQREADPQTHNRRWRWETAAYLRHVGDKPKVRLLAMCRLGLLPVEEETGRWHGIPREKRSCQTCGAKLGDVCHFVDECTGLHRAGDRTHEPIWKGLLECDPKTTGKRWRYIARVVEARWYHKRGANDPDDTFVPTAESESESESDSESDCDESGEEDTSDAGEESGSEKGEQELPEPDSEPPEESKQEPVDSEPFCDSEPPEESKQEPAEPGLGWTQRALSGVQIRREAKEAEGLDSRAAGGVGERGATTLRRRFRNIRRKRRKRSFLPTLDTIYEDEPLL